MTNKQQQFCKEYLVDLNATQAAIRAGYSKKTAANIGNENLIKPEIQQEISKQFAKRCKGIDLKAEEVLTELKSLGMSDITDYVEWSQGRVVLKPSKDIPKHKLKAVKEISSKNTMHGTDITIKLWDKNSALEKLGRYFSLFTGITTEDLETEIQLTIGEFGVDEGFEELPETNMH